MEHQTVRRLKPARKPKSILSKAAFSVALVALMGMLAVTGSPGKTHAGGTGYQTAESETGVSPAGALLRSFVMPGWGHYAADPTDWTRGQVHLGADLAMLASYVLLANYQHRLEGNLHTFGDQYSGINLSERERSFRLAVAGYNSLREYNDYQERSRNWDRIYPETDENYWEWESDEKRQSYNEMRSRRDNIERQAPALLGMMVVNRVIAGVSAFTTVRSQGQNYSVYVSPVNRPEDSVQATLRIDF